MTGHTEHTDPPKRWVIVKITPLYKCGVMLQWWHEPSCSWVDSAMKATQYSENQRMSMPLPPEGRYELLGGPLGSPEKWIVLRLGADGREMNPPEYWSNDGGWVVGVENATIFSATERDDYQYLPQGGAWSELTGPSDQPNWTEIDTSTD